MISRISPALTAPRCEEAGLWGRREGVRESGSKRGCSRVGVEERVFASRGRREGVRESGSKRECSRVGVEERVFESQGRRESVREATEPLVAEKELNLTLTLINIKNIRLMMKQLKNVINTGRVPL